MRRSVLVAALAFLTLTGPTASADPLLYVVQSGDILGAIAAQHSVSVDDLRRWNHVDGDFITIGQELTIYPDDESSSSGGSDASAGRGGVYVVVAGDTVSRIASRNDCEIEDILAWNPSLNPDRIRIGQEISLGRTGRERRRMEYEVQPGDFLGRIASRNNTTVDAIVSWNPSLNPDRIRIGQVLTIWQDGGANSVSIGRPNDGELVEGEQLPGHRLYTLRDPDRSWGTNETVSYIIEAFDHVASTFPSSPRVEMHDLSLEDGGRMRDHRSHQSGRDADIGYFHEDCRGTCDYESVDPDELDFARNWELLSYWIENDMVEYVFMDYSYQRALHHWLEDNGADDDDLDDWFQYPRGRDAAHGIIRHERNHADHMHVRFNCAEGDDRCR